ncbi:hypothetical protein [Rossellomorea marisflavi]
MGFDHSPSRCLNDPDSIKLDFIAHGIFRRTKRSSTVDGIEAV